MDITNNIKTGLTFVGDTVSEIAASVAEKNRLRVQLNHIKGVIKADNATRDQAYIELGRYFYENMRDTAAPEYEAICTVIDAASDRISKASMKYVELLNIQNDTKIRSENAEKLAKAISDKAAETAAIAKDKGTEAFGKAKDIAASTAEKAKVTAADLAEKAKETATELKDKAADAVDEMKDRFDPETNSDLAELIASETEAEAAEVESKINAEAEEAAKAEAESAEKAAENEESPEDIGF